MLALESVKMDDLGARRIPFFPVKVFFLPALTGVLMICVIGGGLSKSTVGVLGDFLFVRR